MRRLLFPAIFAMFAVAMSTAAAYANPHDYTVVVSPNPTPGESYVTVSGCGYKPGMELTIGIMTSTTSTFNTAVVGDDGCFSAQVWAAGFSGTWDVLVETGTNFRVLATGSITIQ
jgi:hypothetical protein